MQCNDAVIDYVTQVYDNTTICSEVTSQVPSNSTAAAQNEVTEITRTPAGLSAMTLPVYECISDLNACSIMVNYDH